MRQRLKNLRTCAASLAWQRPQWGWVYSYDSSRSLVPAGSGLAGKVSLWSCPGERRQLKSPLLPIICSLKKKKKTCAANGVATNTLMLKLFFIIYLFFCFYSFSEIKWSINSKLSIKFCPEKKVVFYCKS